MKIAVIGYSGAGKSTLAGVLAGRYGLPLLYLDKVQFVENWQERGRGEALAMVEEFMAQPGWVIDGNYAPFHFDRRMAEADRIVFLNFNRLTCLFQAVGRYFNYKGKVRESAAEGCPEQMDWEFIRWLLWEGRSKKRFRGVCERYRRKVVELKNRSEVARFLEEI